MDVSDNGGEAAVSTRNSLALMELKPTGRLSSSAPPVLPTEIWQSICQFIFIGITVSYANQKLIAAPSARTICPPVKDLLSLAKTCHTIDAVAYDLFQDIAVLSIDASDLVAKAVLESSACERFSTRIKSISLRNIFDPASSFLESPSKFGNLRNVILETTCIKGDYRGAKVLPKLRLPFDYSSIDLTREQSECGKRLISDALDEATRPNKSRYEWRWPRYKITSMNRALCPLIFNKQLATRKG